MPHSPQLKLTDTQLVILSRAAQHIEGRLELPDHLRGGAADRVIYSLLKHGLIRAADASPPTGFAPPLSLPCYAITRQGLAAISLEPAAAELAENEASPHHHLTPKPVERILTSPEHCLSDAGYLARNRDGIPSKRAQVLTLLQTEEGASMEAIMATTGWQAHTIRAVISGFRKRGLDVERVQDPAGVSCYRIVDFAEAEAGDVASSVAAE